MALFSVYVHLPPDKPLLPETSLFSRAEIIDRISASWGSFELAQVQCLYVKSPDAQVLARFACLSPQAQDPDSVNAVDQSYWSYLERAGRL